jgi:hypothetical protein
VNQRKYYEPTNLTLARIAWRHAHRSTFTGSFFRQSSESTTASDFVPVARAESTDESGGRERSCGGNA